MVERLNTKDFELLSFIEQEYLTNGGIPSKERALEAGITEGPHYDGCLKRKLFREALLTRGIPLPVTTKSNGVLSEHQLIVANSMLDLRDNRSQAKKLRELNCPTAKWEGWLRDPAFQAYLRNRAENLLGDNLHESHLALVGRVRSGDVNAIKYYNEITGRFVSGADSKVDIHAVISLIVEAIQRHVTDPAILEPLADDIIVIARSAAAGAGGSLSPAPRGSSGPVSKSPVGSLILEPSRTEMIAL